MFFFVLYIHKVKRFKAAEGKNVGETTRSCLLIVLKEELAAICNWAGQSEKKPIKDCFFIKMIIGKIIYCTNTSIRISKYKIPCCSLYNI